MARPTFQPPKGTRDFYPAELLVRRYITDAWRRVALRHGFDEIDGPTFETSALYKVKSGDAILGEMFGVFSGKDPDDVAAAGRGDPPFVLRPEFTPTLARMYAAKAAQLPKPTKWFCVPNFFRAERQQRGRLREFMQFNVDVVGLSVSESQAESTETVRAKHQSALDMDCEVLCVLVGLLSDLGLTPAAVKIRVGHREALGDLLSALEFFDAIQRDALYRFIDSLPKIPVDKRLEAAEKLGLSARQWEILDSALKDPTLLSGPDFTYRVYKPGGGTGPNEPVWFNALADIDYARKFVHSAFGDDWVVADISIARGLAYYTGTVFEVIAEGERAVAGGGRYDNLVELFGGPPTPACGFGMGDVVLGNLLTDKGLMPEGKGLLDAVSRPMPVRPDVFVIASNDEAAAHLTPLVAQLRRGEESPQYKDALASGDPAKRMKPWDNARYTVPPLHARRSYKATKNVGKLLADASACHARYAAILESANSVTLKNLETGNQSTLAPNQVGAAIARG